MPTDRDIKPDMAAVIASIARSIELQAENTAKLIDLVREMQRQQEQRTRKAPKGEGRAG